MAKKLLYNGYKDKAERYCAICGKPYAERHEIFPGPNRQISIKMGFQVDLCREHHKEIQDNITPWAQRTNSKLKQNCEADYIEKFMDAHNVPKRIAVKAWMNLIGRNYLDDIIPE